jgi:hypothetical protein
MRVKTMARNVISAKMIAFAVVASTAGRLAVAASFSPQRLCNTECF